MFTKVISLFVFSFCAILVAAAPGGTYPSPTKTITVTAAPTATTISQCNTGDAHCCASVKPASAPGLPGLLGAVGVVVHDVTSLIGFDCTPLLDVLGNCAQQPVCCSNNQFNGLVNVGCTAISL